LKGGCVIKKTLKHILILVIVLYGSNDALSAPITFNTALPVAKGEAVARAQARYLRASDDPTSQDRELTVWSLPLVLAYGVTGKLSVFGIIPVIDKELSIKTTSGRITRGGSGIGDITLFGRYTIWKMDMPGQTMRVAPFMGIKLPTGKDRETDSLGRLPQPLQVGSGSWDPLGGVVFTWQTLNWQIDASLSYRHNTEANDYRFGDTGKLDLSYQYRILPRKLGRGLPAFVYAVLESNLVVTGKDKKMGSYDENTGGFSLFLTPGIQYVTQRTVFETAVQIPVIQDLNGEALKRDFLWILSVRVNF
jgi:hypothetical protein